MQYIYICKSRVQFLCQMNNLKIGRIGLDETPIISREGSIIISPFGSPAGVNRAKLKDLQGLFYHNQVTAANQTLAQNILTTIQSQKHSSGSEEVTELFGADIWTFERVCMRGCICAVTFTFTVHMYILGE